MQAHQYPGQELTREVVGGQRLYYLDVTQRTPQALNVMLEIFGILVGLAGVLCAGYTVWRHHTRQ